MADADVVTISSQVAACGGSRKATQHSTEALDSYLQSWKRSTVFARQVTEISGGDPAWMRNVLKLIDDRADLATHFAGNLRTHPQCVAVACHARLGRHLSASEDRAWA
jgi:hypothetical protein